MRTSRWSRPTLVALLAATVPLGPAAAQSLHQGDQLQISRATAALRIDGDLSDEAWRTAERIDGFYEISPGDNIAPQVQTIGWLAYDDRFLYAAFEFLDPNPAAIRAPYADRDQINGNSMDYGGLFMDTLNDGHSAVLMLVTPSGVQYDAVMDDATGNENSSPDFFWDSAARLGEQGWTLELRIPFSSLRYRDVNPQTWGIALYRNYPRDFRYQIASTRVPRGGNCVVCLINPLVGLEGLPSQHHFVAAPYLSTTSIARPGDGPGTPLTDSDTRPEGGVDVKWNPNADTALDFAVNPDFSHIEADVAQITANEQFALSFPEKRPFFLEGVELLSTPIRAVYTRSITDPRWGARATGKAGGISYTALATEDAGGGSVVIPGPLSSSLEPQDFTSSVIVVRAKRDIGRSFLGLLATDREVRGGGRYNRVAGPDFQWRYSNTQMLTGQWLLSDTNTGVPQSVASHAADVEWRHNSTHLELTSRYKDSGDGFRADAGFVPQVGFRELSGRAGWTVRPTGFVRELRTSVTANRQTDQAGALVLGAVIPSISMNVPWNGFMQFRLVDDRVRSGDQLFDRRQFGWFVRFSPSQAVARISLDGIAGTNVDFTESRPARGVTINLSTELNVTRRLTLALVQTQRWLNIEDEQDAPDRLFVSIVSRLRGNYMFTANSFVRVIAQYSGTRRNPASFRTPVRARSGTFSGSALFAYKINWQSVLFVGYGDDRELSDTHELDRISRQFFAKLSYAFQR